MTIKNDRERYDRHLLIRGWQQEQLERQKVFIAGLGGNGSLMFESMVSLGVGRYGWIKACDPDVLEESNVPRIPYACPDQVGKSKAALAQAYACRKAPELPVRCYRDDITSPRMQQHIKDATIVIGCVDRDGPRKVLQEMAQRYLFLYVDLATEIIPEAEGYAAIGQIFTFIPGSQGCMICSGMINLSQAAIDLESKEETALRMRMGYIRGTNESPAASVRHLNGVTSHLAESQILKVIFGEEPAMSSFIQYDRQKVNLMRADIVADENCPVCGVQGCFGAGNPIRVRRSSDEFMTVPGDLLMRDGPTAHTGPCRDVQGGHNECGGVTGSVWRKGNRAKPGAK